MAKFTYQLEHTSDDGTIIWSRGGEFPIGYSSALGLRTLDNVIDLIFRGAPSKTESAINSVGVACEQGTANNERDAIAAWESWAHLYEVQHPMAHSLLSHDKMVFLAGYSAATAPVS